MIEIKIHKEISKYEGKWLFGLTTRQMICTFIGFSISALIWFVGGRFIHETLLKYLLTFSALPFLAAFAEPGGLKAEKFALAFVKLKLNSRRLREEDNIYNEIRNEIIANEIKQASSKKRKKGIFISRIIQGGK